MPLLGHAPHEGSSSSSSSGGGGTRQYRSPEQAEDGPVDNKSDIWSAALVLGLMLQPPCSTESEKVQLLIQLRSCDVARYGHYYAPAERSLLLTMLQKDPRDRPSAKALRRGIIKNGGAGETSAKVILAGLDERAAQL